MTEESKGTLQVSTKSTAISQPQLPQLTKSLVKHSYTEQVAYLEQSIAFQEYELTPATNKQIGAMLAVVAAMLGAPIPPTAVLAKYIEMLSHYPIDLIDQAGTLVLKRHKWNSFPKVADFIEVITEDYTDRRYWLRRTKEILALRTGVSTSPGSRGPLRGQGPRSLGESLPEIKEPT